ncbi:hypothetical protein GCM10020295_34000 [Streptomyces cinereospinus]
MSLTVLAFLVQFGGVLSRALSVQRAPWGNMYEFNITFSTVAVGVYLTLLALKKDVRWLGLPLVTTVLLDLGLAVTVLYTASDQLVPALHSYWLYIHVSTAIVCGAVFYVGAVSALLYLFRDSYENKLAGGGTPGRFAGSVLERLPAAASLDKFSYRVNAAVFPLWTFTIIAGAIWAGDAWGPLLGLGPQGDLVVHHLGRLRRLPARPCHGRLEGPQGRLPGADRVRMLAVQLLRREHLRLRQALLRRRRPRRAPVRRLLTPRTTGKAGSRDVRHGNRPSS